MALQKETFGEGCVTNRLVRIYVQVQGGFELRKIIFSKTSKHQLRTSVWHGFVLIIFHSILYKLCGFQCTNPGMFVWRVDAFRNLTKVAVEGHRNHWFKHIESIYIYIYVVYIYIYMNPLQQIEPWTHCEPDTPPNLTYCRSQNGGLDNAFNFQIWLLLVSMLNFRE